MTSVAPSKAILEVFVFDALEGFGVGRETICRDASFDDLEVDSLDLVELGQAVKKHFALDLRPKDFEEVVTVGDALDLIYGKAGVA